MEFALYYTATAVISYFLAAWILDRMEVAYGKRFKYRNFIFFFLILGLAYATVFLISLGAGPSPPVQQESQGLPEKLDQ
jgi:hypothetical protein